ncbi:hypothetical protein GCM10025869_03550 [Homoserinibacter gongjuensis]|uniref:Uncharacterized protein n=1 Tax=Homoserinibacter gongjuensis TaxID=1162968 RepID=A0ABQ6JT14_9MICO|nr:hypothetical protein GCM10025869_03550 [Homoserinibacter gongjuensis]
MLLAQLQDVLPEVRATLRVEARGRLVEEQQRRGVHEPERDIEAALLATRELLHGAAREAREVEESMSSSARRTASLRGSP